MRLFLWKYQKFLSFCPKILTGVSIWNLTGSCIPLITKSTATVMYCFSSFGVSIFKGSKEGSVGSQDAEMSVQFLSWEVLLEPPCSFCKHCIKNTIKKNYIEITISKSCISECLTCRPAATRTPKHLSMNSCGPLSET